MGRTESRSRSPPRHGRRWRRVGSRSRSGPSRSCSRRQGSRSLSPPRRGRGGGCRRSPSRGCSSRRRAGRGPPPRNGRARSNSNDRRPLIEKAKGGVKLFVGRLPREVTQRQIRECFEEFGNVLEVFVIASQAQSGVGCAFVRMETIKAAEEAVLELHEQRVLIPEQADLGPMQVAFAKGEAVRLGLDETEEILPTFREAKQKVVEHQEKKMFFEAMKRHQEFHQEMMLHHQAVLQQQHMIVEMVSDLPLDVLVGLVKEGQRMGGQGFKQRWWTFCDQGLGGRDYDPSKKDRNMLIQFLRLAAVEYGMEQWFRKYFSDLPEIPPKPQAPPPLPPNIPGMPPMPPLPGLPGIQPGLPPMMTMSGTMPGLVGMPGIVPPGMMPMLPPPPGLAPPRGGPPSGGRPSNGAPNASAKTPALENKKDAADDASDSTSEAGNIEDINTDDI